MFVSDDYLKRKIQRCHSPVLLSPEMYVRMLLFMCIDRSMTVCEKEVCTVEVRITPTQMEHLQGFGSSIADGTVKTLRELLPDFDIVALDIPVDPTEGLPFLRGFCMNEVPDIVVCIGMGHVCTADVWI